jgi:hypothetical protein
MAAAFISIRTEGPFWMALRHHVFRPAVLLSFPAPSPRPNNTVIAVVDDPARQRFGA